MDAGIPIVRPVAGISVGICTEYDDQKAISRYKLLTDIIGWEDAFCDMDCDGIKEGGDTPVEGLRIRLMCNATFTDSTFTESSSARRRVRMPWYFR